MLKLLSKLYTTLLTISINVNKTPVACFEYTLAPRRRAPRYHDHFDAVFPSNVLPFVSLTRPPRYPDRGHSPAVTKLLIEHCVTRPPYSIGILTLEN